MGHDEDLAAVGNAYINGVMTVSSSGASLLISLHEGDVLALSSVFSAAG